MVSRNLALVCLGLAMLLGLGNLAWQKWSPVSRAVIIYPDYKGRQTASDSVLYRSWPIDDCRDQLASLARHDYAREWYGACCRVEDKTAKAGARYHVNADPYKHKCTKDLNGFLYFDWRGPIARSAMLAYLANELPIASNPWAKGER